MTNKFLLWSILSLIFFKFWIINLSFSDEGNFVDCFPKSFKTRNTVYQADTLRESFHRILERENELHLYFKCTSDVTIDTPNSFCTPSPDFMNEWIIVERDTSANGEVTLTAIEPDLGTYSETSLLLNASYEEIRSIIATCFSRKKIQRYSALHAQIYVDLLVDYTGRVIETSHHLYADRLISDISTLRTLAKLDGILKEEVQFNDDGRFMRYHVAHGWTRLVISFRDNTVYLTGLPCPHP